jgi:RNA recognition motif-containing protein
MSTIFVEDLSASINDTTLTRHFSDAGSVIKVDAFLGLVTSTAQVTFKTDTAADYAVAYLNGSKILGRPCRVSKPVEVVAKQIAKLVVPEMPIAVSS